MESEITVNTIIFIVALIVPGIFFKRFYFQGQFSQQFGAGLFADRLITSIFWGIFVQIISFLLFSRMLGFTYTEIKESVSTGYTDITHNIIPKQIDYKSIKYLLGYLFFTTIIAAVLGAIIHKVIRFFKIDLKFEVFRFSNQWNYYFKGEILATKDFAGAQRGRVLSTQVDLVIDECGTGNKMVTGFLTKYTLSSDSGQLETLYLTGTKRFSNTTNNWKEIPGDCFIIPYQRVMNMNVRYNILSTPAENWKPYVRLILNTMLVFGVFFLIIYPWFLPILLIKKIIASIISPIPLILLAALITAPLQTGTNKQPITGIILLQAFFAILITSIVALIILEKFTSIVDAIWSVFNPL